MYRIFSVLSLIIRHFFLPNPFEQFAGNEISVFGSKQIIEPNIANWFAEIILYPTSFFVAGLFYKRDMNMPTLGSFLYFLFYCLHSGLLYVFCKLSFSMLPCLLVIIVYVAFLIFIKATINRHSFINTHF